ncbi:MAG: pyridoxal phosphate-dependent aminotransferase [Candidatus Neomarinimicrobiota bacterium]
MKTGNFSLPLDRSLVDGVLGEGAVDLARIGIRELRSLVDRLSAQSGIEYLRFEFGIPGLPAERIGPEEEIKVLKENERLPSTYPPFDGIPRLKKASAVFAKKFLNIDVSPENCVPTVGAMQGGFISQAVAGRRKKESSTILYIDPGFPVNKLQTKFLGLNSESIDLYDCRGTKLLKKLEETLSSRKIGALLWSNPNNPTWSCLKDEELKGIGNLLTEYDVIGIEDAAYFGMDFRSDYSVPGEPPFQPTVAHYTDNYFVIISSSKIFSYAGQRIAVTIISPGLMNRRYANLKHYYDTDILGYAFIYGGVYATTAGVPQAPQHAFAAFMEAACDRKYNFLKKVRQYGERAHKAKQVFQSYGFDLLYKDDLGEPIADGFYFTICRENMTGEELLYHMLCFGLAGIPLKPTGTVREGIRICVSLLDEHQYGELERRVSALDKYLRREFT